MNDARATRRAGFSLGELLVVIALVAVLAAFVLKVKQDFANAGRSAQSLVFSSDGKRLLAAFNDGSVQAWDLADGRRIASYPPPQDNLYYYEIALSPDGRTVARCYEAPARFKVELRDLNSGNLSRQINVGIHLCGMAFSLDGKQLALAESSVNKLRFINVDDSDIPEIEVAPLNADSSGGLLQAGPSFSADGRFVYYIEPGGELVRWNLTTHQAERKDFKAELGGPLRINTFAVSPNGTSIVLNGAIGTPTKPIGIPMLWMVKADGLTLVGNRISSGFATGVAFFDSGKSLAVLADDLEILDAETFQSKKKVPLQNGGMGMALAASADGKLLAIADFDSIYLYDGNSLRKFVEYRSSISFLPLVIVFGVFVFLLLILRLRSKTRVCVQCGKKWVRADKSADRRCPDCRMLGSTTEQLIGEQKKTKRTLVRTWVKISLLLAFGASLSVMTRLGEIHSFGDFLLAVLAPVAGIAVFFVAVMAILIAIKLCLHRWTLRRLRNTERALTLARKAAGTEGRIEEFGPVTLWTDSPKPLAETAETIAAELDDCRRRVEELTGAACQPVRPILLLAFSTAAAAHRYAPLWRLDAARNSIYLGPYADQGFFSLESLRRLVPLSVSIRGLLFLHCVRPTTRKVPMWWNFGLGRFVAIEIQPSQLSSDRRQLAVWRQENSLLPLEELFRQGARIFFNTTSAALLPENHERYLKIVNQTTSLVDYFCGHEAPPERRRQFQRLWQEAQCGRKMEAICQAALGYGLAQLESDWQAWLAAAEIEPPAMAPPEMAEVAERDVIPVARDIVAPLQERIKAIRALGGCGWTIGIETLNELLNDPQPDVRREVKRALQLLLGRAEVGSVLI
jgi:prepilin-type N-terminal cleavage/methylation domain-containing protein